MNNPPKYFIIFTACVKTLNRLFESIAIICLIGISALIFGQIILRNIFSIGLPWLDEMARFLHIALVFLMVPVLLSEDGHIRIDFLSTRLKPHWQRWLQIVILTACVLFAGAFLVSDIEFMSSYWDVPSPAMSMPNIIFFGSAFVGMAGLLLNTLGKLVYYILTSFESGAETWAE
jgi:TRAP-type C4-dicarboxylate transport system permease small subunit